MSIIEEEEVVPTPTISTLYSEDSVFGSNFDFNIDTLIEKMDFIPQEFQLPFVIALGILGFLAVLGLSKISSRRADSKVQFDSPSTPNKTPMKTRSNSGTPIEQKTGTVMTPAGRRSARIARTRRKEE